MVEARTTELTWAARHREVSVSRTVSPEAPGGFVIPGATPFPRACPERVSLGLRGQISWTQGWHPVVCGSPCGALRAGRGLVRVGWADLGRCLRLVCGISKGPEGH